jgi:HEAT repeat protein
VKSECTRGSLFFLCGWFPAGEKGSHPVARDPSVHKNTMTAAAAVTFVVITLVSLMSSGGCGRGVSTMQAEGDIPGLVAMLQGDDPPPAADAAAALAALADSASVEPLIAVIEADPFSSAASDAVEILTEIGDERAVPAIISVLETAPSASAESRVERYEQPAAIKALAEFADPRAAAPIVNWVKEHGAPLSMPDDEKAVVDEALKAIGKGAVEPLVAAAEDSEASSSVRDWALRLLGDIGDPAAAPALVEMLADTGVDRVSVASSLSKIGTGAIDALLEGLKSKDWVVVTYSAKALGQIGDERAEAPLLALMKSGVEGAGGVNTKQAASDALALVNKADAPKLVAWLAAKETVFIYYGLIHLGLPETEGALLKAFDRYASKGMAEAFLNSGNAALSAEAKAWAKANDYDITTFSNLSDAEYGWGSLAGE